MLQLKDYQTRAVKKLKENILDMLSLQDDRQKIVFKAPTGAGKTVMASALLDELNMELQSKYMEAALELAALSASEGEVPAIQRGEPQRGTEPR